MVLFQKKNMASVVVHTFTESKLVDIFIVHRQYTSRLFMFLPSMSSIIYMHFVFILRYRGNAQTGLNIRRVLHDFFLEIYKFLFYT
jgi:hypothetical protein